MCNAKLLQHVDTPVSITSHTILTTWMYFKLIIWNTLVYPDAKQGLLLSPDALNALCHPATTACAPVAHQHQATEACWPLPTYKKPSQSQQSNLLQPLNYDAHFTTPLNKKPGENAFFMFWSTLKNCRRTAKRDKIEWNKKIKKNTYPLAKIIIWCLIRF